MREEIFYFTNCRKQLLCLILKFYSFYFVLLIQVDIFACSQSQDVIYSVFVKAQVSHGVCYDAKSETGPGILFSKLADSLFVSLTKQFHCLNLNKQ